jgi:transcriptional regulator with XRE-family HTH domain
MSKGSSIGARLKELRRDRDLSQERLAERAGLSVDLIKRLEQDRRHSARLDSLYALADALDVPLSRLVDRRPRLDGGDPGTPRVTALRDVLLHPDLLPGLEPAGPEAEPMRPDRIAALVDQAWGGYWAGQFTALTGDLPELIGEARASAREYGAAAARPHAQVHQLAACLLVQMGQEDLAAVAAERAIRAAAAGDDELLHATLHGTYSWIMHHQGRFTGAVDLATQVADRIEPRMSTASPQHLTVWGGLLLSAVAPAAAADQRDTLDEVISLARAGAARLDHDRHDYQVSYGPTQVAMQATYGYAATHRPEAALRHAAQVRREDLLGISYGAHLVDVAQAHVDGRADDAAVAVLRTARSTAPVWFRHQPLARGLVQDLRQRALRLRPELRDLVDDLGLD